MLAVCKNSKMALDQNGHHLQIPAVARTVLCFVKDRLRTRFLHNIMNGARSKRIQGSSVFIR